MLKGKRWIAFLSIVAILLFVSACNKSDEDIRSHAKESFERKMLEEDIKETTFSDERIEFYLPSFAETEKVDEHNILIDKEGQFFLLFGHEAITIYNEEELLESLMIEEDPFIFETGEINGELVYFIVLEADEDQYTTMVGYDHFKITTVTNLNNLSEDAKLMFDIVRSANLK